MPREDKLAKLVADIQNLPPAAFDRLKKSFQDKAEEGQRYVEKLR